MKTISIVSVLIIMLMVVGTAAAAVETGWTLGVPNTHDEPYVLVDFNEGSSSYSPVSCPVDGITFVAVSGDPWVYACMDLNVRNETSGSGNYLIHGNAGAWCGKNGNGGKVEFDYPVSHVSCLASIGTSLTMVAYDSNDNEVVNSGWAGNNLNTDTFTRMSVDRNESDISYVIIHDAGNYWLIDDLVVSREPTFVIGDVFNNKTEPIVVNWVDNAGSCDLTLTYDASIVRVVGVSGGDMDNMFTNSGDGWIRIGAYQGDNPGLNGSFVLANVSFERVSDGTCPLNITVTTYKDSSPAGIAMDYQTINGTYCSYSNGDVNGDGDVDMFDAMYLAKHVIGISLFGNIVDRVADVDGNGVIDINDAMYLAKHVLDIDGYEELR